MGMKHYTDTIPLDLAEKLKEKGMPMMTSASISIVEDKPVVDKNGEQWYRPMFCEVFDWLMEKGTYIIIGKLSGESYYFQYECARGDIGSLYHFPTWHEAANKAIEIVLKLK